jgi:protein phosphatase
MKIDVGEVTVRPGDVMLLCSDGLFKVVKETVIKSVMAASSSALMMCKTLVGTALQGGGPDNVTVAIIKFSNPSLLQKAASLLRVALVGKRPIDG